MRKLLLFLVFPLLLFSCNNESKNNSNSDSTLVKKDTTKASKDTLSATSALICQCNNTDITCYEIKKAVYDRMKAHLNNCPTAMRKEPTNIWYNKDIFDILTTGYPGPSPSVYEEPARFKDDEEAKHYAKINCLDPNSAEAKVTNYSTILLRVVSHDKSTTKYYNISKLCPPPNTPGSCNPFDSSK